MEEERLFTIAVDRPVDEVTGGVGVEAAQAVHVADDGTEAAPQVLVGDLGVVDLTVCLEQAEQHARENPAQRRDFK